MMAFLTQAATLACKHSIISRYELKFEILNESLITSLSIFSSVLTYKCGILDTGITSVFSFLCRNLIILQRLIPFYYVFKNYFTLSLTLTYLK